MIIWWLFELLFDDYLSYLMIIWWLFDSHYLLLFAIIWEMIIRDYLIIIWYWLFVIIRWLCVPNYLWLFDDYLPFVALEPVPRLRLGGSETLLQGHLLLAAVLCRDHRLVILDYQRVLERWRIRHNVIGRTWRQRLLRRQLCGRMIHLVPGHERQPAIRKNPPLWLVPKGLLTGKTRKWSATQGTMWTESM